MEVDVMDKQIKDIINKYQFDQKTRTYSNKHYFKNNSIYASVHSNDDVERLLEGVKNHIVYFENFDRDLVADDIIELEKSLAKYENAIHKVLACFDNPHCNFNYSAEELIQLINNWDEFNNIIKDIHFRKACQD